MVRVRRSIMGKAKIYTDLKLMRYRVYKKKSDKIEVSFGWKKQSMAEAWAKATALVKELNPKVDG